MKPSSLFVAVLAAFTTAIALPAAEDTAIDLIQDRAVVNIGADFTSGLVDMVAKFPGTKEIKKTFICMRRDKHWKADYSQKGQGIVTFSNVPTKCCNLAKDGWNKYHQDWQKLATPVFDASCNAGALTKMKPSHIDKLHRIIGDGSGGH